MTFEPFKTKYHLNNLTLNIMPYDLDQRTKFNQQV